MCEIKLTYLIGISLRWKLLDKGIIGRLIIGLSASLNRVLKLRFNEEVFFFSRGSEDFYGWLSSSRGEFSGVWYRIPHLNLRHGGGSNGECDGN